MKNGGATGFAVRAAAFSVAVFFANGAYIPFFPIWLSARGMGEAEIGLLVAAPLLARILFTPLVVGAADSFPSLRSAAAFYSVVAGLVFAMLAFVSGFWPILLFSALSMLMWSAQGPISDATTMYGVRKHGIDYARVRLWGSLGFMGGTLAGAAAVERVGEEAVLPVIAVSYILAGAFAMVSPRVPTAAVGGETVGMRRALFDPTLRRALIAGNLVLGGHGAFYAFGSLFWQTQGFSGSLIGVLWAYSVAAEVAVFWVAKLLPGWGARRLILMGSAAALFRWSFFPFATDPLSAFALQTLHAASFGLTHLGIMMAIGAVTMPGHTARLQAAHQLIGGVMLATAMAGSGPLFRISPLLAFSAMSAAALLGLVIALGLRRGLQPQTIGSGGSTTTPE
jgi:MFS transporter, PPP family, 3-phenylpropionic acid transporter